MTDDVRTLNGGCLCGAVRFSVDNPMAAVVACHCGQCRKTTGNFFTSINAMKSDVSMTEERGLAWFKSSEKAERGFCKECGSNLFWRGFGSDEISITAGSFEGKTGFHMKKHIYVADKPDWYEITDGKPQFDGLR